MANRLPPVIVRPATGQIPAWAERAAARVVEAAALDGEEATNLLAGAGCALLDATARDFVSLARRVHALDADLQVVAVTPPETLQATRHALIYAPGLGEVWVASPTDVSGALAERAAGVTRQRRRFARTRSRVENERLTTSPQRAERALISDAYLAGLLHVLPDPVFSLDAGSRVLSANAAAERVFGRRDLPIVGTRLGALCGFAHDEGDEALLRRSTLEGYLVVRFVAADGRQGTAELRATELARASAATAAWVVVLRDVTEQQAVNDRLQDTAIELEASNEELQSTTEELFQRTTEAEHALAALRESEASYRALADAIPTLAWTARADGYIDWYNQRWYEYTSTTPEQMAGWGWQSVHDPRTLPDVVARWQASIVSGTPFEMTFPLRGADGRFRPFLTRVVPLRGSEGQVLRWFGTNTDVESERAARERVERLQALTEVLAGAQSLDDVAAVVVARSIEASSAATGILAMLSPAGDEGLMVQHIGVPAFVTDRFGRFPLAAPIPVAVCIRTGEAAFVESREGPDGLFARYEAILDIWERLGTHAIAVVPLFVAGGVVGALSFTFTEPRTFSAEDRAFFLAFGRQCAQAVERARLFGAEHAAREHADEANRSKSQFLATMSHELRTPLNAIGGYVQLLQLGLHGPLTSAQTEALERVQRSQHHLLGLINEVLNFARLETGTVHYELTAVPVHEALDDAESLVAPQARGRGLTLVVARPGQEIFIRADAEKLRQVLVNLLSNAVKFTDPGGRIELWCEQREAMALVHVRDTGIGIPPDKLEAVFEPFVQVRANLTRTADGTGLGLAISRDLARGMGGDLTAASTLGQGSTFTLSLPAVSTPAG